MKGAVRVAALLAVLLMRIDATAPVPSSPDPGNTPGGSAPEPDTSGGPHPDTSGGSPPDTSGGSQPDTSGGSQPDPHGGSPPDTSGGSQPDPHGGSQPDTHGSTDPHGADPHAGHGEAAGHGHEEAGHGHGHGHEEKLSCKTIKGKHETENPFWSCFEESCEKAPEASDKCAKALTEWPDMIPCTARRCQCLSPRFGSWDCAQEVCTAQCVGAECWEYVNPDTNEKCEASYRVCQARAMKSELTLLDNPEEFPQCSDIVQCVKEKMRNTTCIDTYRGASSEPCDTAELVHHIIHEQQPDICLAEGECAVSHGHHGAPYNILVLAIIMALGNFCRHFSSTFPLSKIPYTVQMFLLGAGWGALCKNVGGSMLKYGELGDIDPHLLFYIFLPILIFESAFATDFHVFKKVRAHCICLAGPGLIICSLLSALVAKTFFKEYGWTLVTCLLFGCMLSATDPVAVVALLKELGAAPAISQLIEGESLLNDGTAIVFFNILKDSVIKEEIEEGIGEILLILIKVAGGGCILGWVIGVITKNCIKQVFNDPEIEITLTLVAAYMCFFVAEEYLAVSGVLGLVVMGMYLAYHAHVISPEVEHTLHHFWEIIVYMGNTMIFAIAGIVITEKALEDLHSYDFVYLLINYAFLNVIRALALGVLLWPMNRLGTYQLDWRNAGLCTWGGLRGAVGLALALIIAGDQDIQCYDKYLGIRFLFHVAGVVVLTLCVNGVTTGWVVAKLGLDKIAESRKRNMQRAYRELMKGATDDMYELRRKPVFRDANWAQVKHWVTREIVDPYSGDVLPLEPPEVQEDACEHYYRCFHAAVEHEYESGTMLPSSLRALLEYLSDVEDAAAMGDFRMIDASVLNDQFVLTTIDNISPFGGFQARWMRAFDVGIGFLNCHEQVLKNVEGVCHRAQATNRVKDHCKVIRKEAIAILERHSNQRPEIAMALKSRNAARGILNQARQNVHRQQHKGKIGGDAAALTEMVERNMKDLKKMPHSLMPEDTDKTLEVMCSWYRVSERVHAALRGQYRIMPFVVGENLLGKGVDGTGCFVILSGVVRVHVGNRAENFGPGYSAGLMSILTGKLGKYSEVFAETPIQAAMFPTRIIRELCKYGEFGAAIWDDLCKLTTRKVMCCLPNYRDWSHVKIKNFAEKGKRYPVSGSEAYPTPLPPDSVCVLVSGDYKDVLQGRESGTGPCLVPPSLNTALFTASSVLFVVNNPLTAQEKARKHWSKIRNKIFTVRAIACLQGHEAGLRAVKEVLEGRITGFLNRGMIMGAEEPAPQPVQPNPSINANPMLPGDANYAPAQQVASSSSVTSPYAPSSSPFPNKSLSKPPFPNNYQQPYQQSNAPSNNGSVVPSGRRSVGRASRKYNTPSPSNVEMNPIASQPPTEATPWFSQTEKGAQVHRGSRRGTTSPLSEPQHGEEGLNAPLLRNTPPSRHMSQDDLSSNF